MDAVGAERLHRERGRQRRVDAAGDAEDDLAEAVLLDVVAQAELEAAAHLLELVERARRRGGLARRAGAGRALPTSITGASGAPPRSRASARRRTSRSRRPITSVGSTSTTSSASSNPGARATHLALVVDHARVAVEDELVLAADGVAEREEARVVARARDEHLLALALLADVERRRGEVRRAAPRRRARGRSPAAPAATRPRRSSGRRASRRAGAGRGRARARSSGPRRTRRSSAGSACGRSARTAPSARTAQALRGRGRSAGRRRARRCRGVSAAICSTAPLGRADEPRPQEQVLGRVAGDGELREEDEVGALVACLGEAPDDPVPVAVEVADDGVDLGEREPHGFLPPSLKHRLPVVPTIDPRFNGPPGSGNGGYTCGLVAGLLGGPAEVTLRLPPPLGTPLAWRRRRACSTGRRSWPRARPADVDVEPPAARAVRRGGGRVAPLPGVRAARVPHVLRLRARAGGRRRAPDLRRRRSRAGTSSRRRGSRTRSRRRARLGRARLPRGDRRRLGRARRLRARADGGRGAGAAARRRAVRRRRAGRSGRTGGSSTPRRRSTARTAGSSVARAQTWITPRT